MKTKLLKDKDFFRANYRNGKPVPLTKFEIRVLTLEQLALDPTDIILDIGAGTGGLSVGAALAAPRGKVFAIEKSKEAAKLIEKNARRHGCENVEVLVGSAPGILEKIENVYFDKVIIGGSSGNIEEIISWSLEHLKANGKISANFITVENFYKALGCFRKNLEEVECIQVQISRGQFVGDLTMMKAENPIFILTGTCKK